MEQDSVFIQRPAKLARLLKLDESPASWSPSDLSSILRHQLDSPLDYDLADLAAKKGVKLDSASGPGDEAPLRTFADVLSHPHPPVAVLRLIKDFAKAGGHQNGSIPSEVATLLYQLAILVARVRCGDRISSQSDTDSRQGGQWALEQSWIDDRTRAIVRSCLDALQ